MQFRSIVALFLLTACASGPALNNTDGLQAERLEIAMDASGRASEIEYHIKPDAVPAAVHKAMNSLHPGPQATAAEKEYEGSKLYWELTKRIDGFKVESMFRPDGTLHSQEIEVPESKIPQAVRSAVSLAAYGPVRAWEQIQDGQQRIVEYHAKTSREGRNFKLLVSPAGKVLGIFREIEAEIEVPVR